MDFPLDGDLIAYRIARSGPFPVYSGEGARRYGARWNSAGRAVIYGSLCYATSLLEQMVHLNGGPVPTLLRYILIRIPKTVLRRHIDLQTFSGWNADDLTLTQAFGDQWHERRREAVLLLPSVVAPLELNVLINPDHDDAGRITHDGEQPIVVDRRLRV